jgi:hypothetical protein
MRQEPHRGAWTRRKLIHYYKNDNWRNIAVDEENYLVQPQGTRTRPNVEQGNGVDDAALDQAEAALRAASDRVSTLTAALAESEQQVVALERERDALADRKVRAATAAQIEKMAVELEQAGVAFEAAAAKLVTACARHHSSCVTLRLRFNLPQPGVSIIHAAPHDSAMPQEPA